MFKNKKYISLMVLLLLFVCAPAVSAQNQVDEMRDLVAEYYVDVPPAAFMQAGSVDEMLNILGDPHTMYFTGEEYQAFQESFDQRFFGIGIYMEIVPQGVKVLSAIKGTPAEEAGIKNGDIITRAGGYDLKGLDEEESMARLRGPEGSKVKLTIQRGVQTFQVVVTRKEVDVPTVTGEAVNGGKTGYIAIDSFGQNTDEELGAEVKSLQAAGVKNWIIDLRGNPGGYLDTAFEMAGYFIGEKPVITVKERDYSQVGTGVKQEFMITGPVIVLVDENSASASEVLTGALQDYHRAVVMGRNTYGKGTVQEIFPLSGGDVLKLTIARFYSPNGGVIDRKGITPDLVIDPQSDGLQAAEDLLAGNDGDEAKWPEIKGVSCDIPFFATIPGESKNASNPPMVLIQSDTGHVVPVQVKNNGQGGVLIMPTEVLKPATEYWLLTGSPNPGQGLVRVKVIP
jgi:carboxyl-terminal processing protease